ncbi:glycosyltransferase [Treponema socranskii]|uniref:glycosyltransferase n=1 Tax=Treponema socranskii TaxID=53419 RepID=UPI002870DFB3|nr:glycosyltransferase [Treponema socranskii]MDR9859875.1 glycosyltransferase [Treponema socranskii]
MKVLVLNVIMYTPEHGTIPQVTSLKDTVIYNFCKGLLKNGHNVTLCVAEDYRPTKDEDYEFEVIFFESKFTKLFKPSLLPYSPKLRNYIKEHNKDFDVIISKDIFQFPSLFAAKICPEKTILWTEAAAHKRFLFKLPSKFWHSVIFKSYFNKVNAIVAQSEPAKIFTRQYSKKITEEIVGFGINLDVFEIAENKKRQLISSSQLIQRKNVDGVIRAFAEFHKIEKYKDVKLYIAGRGEEEQHLKELVKNLNLTDCVIFLGFLSHTELCHYISESLLFFLNTRMEMNPVSILESIASGTPVLTTENLNLAHFIHESKVGIAKNDWNINDIITIIENNNTFVENCLKYRNEFSIETIAQKLVGLCKRR